MKKLLYGVLLLSVISIIPGKQITYVSVEPKMALAFELQEKTIWTKEELVTIAKEKAHEHNISQETNVRVMICETPWKIDREGLYGPKYALYYDKNDAQSRLRYTEGQIRRNPSWGNVGDLERSFGPAQIHEPAHPNITREQATDPEWALNFMAEEFANGRGNKWTCK